MTRLAILEYPDPRLRTKAEPVSRFDADLSRLVDDMFETLYASRAIGLAATQVDAHVRLIVIDVSDDRSAPSVFINPEILLRREIGMVEESCLSVPGVMGDVVRATKLRVRALDRHGVPFECDLEGLAAVCLQHEIDHLLGTLFVDRLSFWKRLKVRRELRRGGRAVAAAEPGGSLAPGA
jgi:peptide deformylase